MSISYLKGYPWSRWTREERYFCSVLYSHAISNPADFAAWLIESAELSADKAGEWDLGYEVCLYRDYLWQIGETARSKKLPQKRTFDLCLFGTQSLIVIEAKVSGLFNEKQLDDCKKDKVQIPSLPGFEQVKVYVVSLASSTYFENVKKYGNYERLSVFDGRLRWVEAAIKYSCPLLHMAERKYKPKPGEAIGGGSTTGAPVAVPPR